MFPSSALLESRLNASNSRADPDTEIKVRSSIRYLNETIHGNANEPSLAFYRIQVFFSSLIDFIEIIFHLGTHSKNITEYDSKTSRTRTISRKNERSNF